LIEFSSDKELEPDKEETELEKELKLDAEEIRFIEQEI